MFVLLWIWGVAGSEIGFCISNAAGGGASQRSKHASPGPVAQEEAVLHC